MEQTINYMKKRKQFGKTNVSFQVTQFKIAETATVIETLRTLISEDMVISTITLLSVSTRQSGYSKSAKGPRRSKDGDWPHPGYDLKGTS